MSAASSSNYHKCSTVNPEVKLERNVHRSEIREKCHMTYKMSAANSSNYHKCSRVNPEP